jgi:hypothetical protein
MHANVDFFYCTLEASRIFSSLLNLQKVFSSRGLIMNEVLTSVNVFGSGVLDVIVGNLDGTFIVT